MEAGAASHNLYGFCALEHFFSGGAKGRREQAATSHALFKRLRYGAGLLVNFLEHVVRVVTALHSVRRKLAFTLGAYGGLAIRIQNLQGLTRHQSHIAFFQKHELARYRQKRSHVRGHIVFAGVLANPNTQYHRAASTCHHQLLGHGFTEHG